MVAPLNVVVHQQNLSGFEIVFEILVHCLIIHIEKITGVILTIESHGWLPEFSKSVKTPKMHLYVQIYQFICIFPVHTKTHIKYNK